MGVMRLAKGTRVEVRTSLYYAEKFIPAGTIVLITAAARDEDGLSYVCRIETIPRTGSRYTDVVRIGDTARLMEAQVIAPAKSARR